MSSKHPRVIGATPQAITRAEQALGRPLPQSFRAWLAKNNGHWGIDAIRVIPVLDDRDPRSTWDSIDRQFRERWKQWRDIHAESDLSHLLPFAEFGTGDYYCFDYSRTDSTGEPPVVLWFHGTGEVEERADSFSEFLIALEKTFVIEKDDRFHCFTETAINPKTANCMDDNPLVATGLNWTCHCES